MEEKVEIIKHQDVSEEEKYKIGNIKMAFVNNSLYSQFKWMDENLAPSDLHFLLYENRKLIGYLNLVSISVVIDNHLLEVYGIGNVCSDEKGKGYGKRLIKQLNTFLKNKDMIGLLFCKKNLLFFYSQYNWIKLNREKVNLAFNNKLVETMIFNYPHGIEFLEYRGILF